MIKNTVFMKHLKRFFVLGLALVVTITLSGCSNTSNSFPLGGLNSNEIYASNGTTNLTISELYSELRHNSVAYLTTQVEEVVFDEYIKKVDLTDEDQKETISEYMLKDIFGTFDDEELADMKQVDLDSKIAAFIDKVYYEGIYLDANVDFDFRDGTPSVVGIQDTSAYTALTSKYSLNVAKYLYAIEQLEKEIKEQDADAAKDEDVNPYFTDSVIAQHYDSNFSYTDDVNALIVRFVSSAEADAVFKAFGIKAYKGEWYQINLPTNDNDLVDVSQWEKESDYNTYYDNYVINTSSLTGVDNTIKSLGNGNETILKLFIEMYNYIYTYRNPITYTSSVSSPSSAPKEFLTQYYKVKDIINGDSKDENGYQNLVNELNTGITNQTATTFTKDKLDSYSTSLTKYVNSTLRISPEIDEETEEELSFVQYSSTSVNYGNSNYIVFKISDTPEEEFYTTTEDEDGNTLYTFNDDAMKEEILAELFDGKLTDSYISNKATERMEDVKINIFDKTIDLLYTQANPTHSSKGSSDKYVATITYNKKDYNISVDELYLFLEEIYGPATAVKLLFDKQIMESDYYKDLVGDYEDYKTIVSQTLTYFANDAYASYGYPASMGKYNFMLLYFRSANVDKAIEYLTLQDAKAEYFIEITSQSTFSSTMEEFYELAYENYYSLSLNSILVYADYDEDGVADKDYFTTDDEADNLLSKPLTALEKQALAEELVDELIKYAKNSTVNLATSFQNAVAEYNSSTRVTPSTEPEYSGSIEHKWAKYRQAGLLVSTSELGEFNNATNLEDEIQSLVETLYNDSDNEIIFDNSFSSPYLVENINDINGNNSVLTSDGYNVLLVTGGNGKTNIDFENEKSEFYTNVPVKINDKEYKFYDLSSTSEIATTAQIEAYCIEYFRTGSSVSLPASASTHLSTYLQPALAKFNSEASQLLIMNNALNITTTTEKFNERLDSFISLKQRELDGYVVNNNFTNFWNSAIYTGGNN